VRQHLIVTNPQDFAVDGFEALKQEHRAEPSSIDLVRQVLRGVTDPDFVQLLVEPLVSDAAPDQLRLQQPLRKRRPISRMARWGTPLAVIHEKQLSMELVAENHRCSVQSLLLIGCHRK
jgi:hypothetical protein